MTNQNGTWSTIMATHFEILILLSEGDAVYRLAGDMSHYSACYMKVHFPQVSLSVLVW
jgi:ABC-type transport system involved in cytochrome bd biosynthesis fused ATPase/permease subunit